MWVQESKPMGACVTVNLKKKDMTDCPPLQPSKWCDTAETEKETNVFDQKFVVESLWRGWMIISWCSLKTSAPLSLCFFLLVELY